MSWLIKFFSSSIGRKMIMSLTGLFLIMFLIVHLVGNLQLFVHDDGKAFNIYTHFMSNNPVIQFIAKGNYFFILLHTIQGLLLAYSNKKAKGSKYAVSPANKTSWASNNMALLGTLVLAFLLMHFGHFWFQFKFGSGLEMIAYDNVQMIDAYKEVALIFAQPLWVVCYLVGMIVLAFHLGHGFNSAFQTLGLRHKKYTPIIKFVGKAYAILIPLGFAAIPIYMYFTK